MNGEADDLDRPVSLLPRGGLIDEALRRSNGSRDFERKLMPLMRRELLEFIKNIVRSLERENFRSLFSDALLIAAGSGTAGESIPENEAILLRRASELIHGTAILNSVSQGLEEILTGPVCEAVEEVYLRIVNGPLEAAVTEALAQLNIDPADPVVEQDEYFGFREYVKEIEELPTESIVDDLRPMIEDLKWKARTGCTKAVEELRDIGIQVSCWLEGEGRFSSMSGDVNGTAPEPDGGEVNQGEASSVPIFDKVRAADVVRRVARKSLQWPIAVPAIVDNRKASVEERVSKFSLGIDLPIRVSPRRNGSGSSRKLLPGSAKHFVMGLYLELLAEVASTMSDGHRSDLDELLKSDPRPPKKLQILQSLENSNPDHASWDVADRRSLQWKRRAMLLPGLSRETVEDWVAAMMSLVEFKSDGDLDQFAWPVEITKRSNSPVADGQRGIHAAAREILKRELKDLVGE